MDIEMTRREYDRLCKWRTRWLLLANSQERCSRRWPLKRHTEYMLARSRKANYSIGKLLQALQAWHEKSEGADEH